MTSRQHPDGDLLDRAAALFARRGFAKTSVADLAAAVGLSKAGLLHHYPTKEALHAAVLAHAAALGAQVLAEASRVPAGVGRDRRTIDALLDVALRHPGFVALLLSPVAGAAEPEPGVTGTPTDPSDAVLRAFDVEPDAHAAHTDPERLVRVIGALSALAVLTLVAAQEGLTTGWREHIRTACLAMLGHS